MSEASKFLSYILRHAPESIGLTLGAGGWVEVDELIRRANQAGQKFDRAMLFDLVATSDKKRFTLSEDGTRIRAAQGHSVSVELDLAPAVPPSRLFHGTATRSLAAIRTEGLKPQSRQKVHLSPDRDTAMKVGQRHGAPVVLEILAAEMHAAGHLFWVADNGVWLADVVPPEFLRGI